MRGKTRLLPVVLLTALAVVAACKGSSQPPEKQAPVPSDTARSVVLPIGSPECPYGGIRIDSGNDANNNGLLDQNEISNSSSACNSLRKDKKPIGSSALVEVVSEPTSTFHCPQGGLKVLSGIDANKDNVLEPEEILNTKYVCNGTPGSSRETGITVESGLPAVPAVKDKKKKKAGKSSPSPAKASQSAPVAQQKKADVKERPTSAKARTPRAVPATPEGWTDVNVKSPNAKVIYKMEGRYIVVLFQNLSDALVRMRYTVKWKEGQNGNWKDESTMEGIGLHLNPREDLKREVLTHAEEVKDVVVEVAVSESK